MSDPGPRQARPAVEDLSRLTLADHDLGSVMSKVVELTKTTIPGASEVSVTLVERGAASTAAHTGDIALHLDERQYDRGYGPCLDSIDTGEPLMVPDMTTETRWPDWATEAHARGVGSSLSIPIPLQQDLSAALNIYAGQAGAFDDTAVAMASTFAAYAGVALINMHRYSAQATAVEQMRAAMTSRAVIEQAKGMLMAQRKCSEEDAAAILSTRAQREKRSLSDVARDIVERRSRPAR